jgi:hypothetical protein
MRVTKQFGAWSTLGRDYIRFPGGLTSVGDPVSMFVAWGFLTPLSGRARPWGESSYYKPSSLFGQFGDERVTEVGLDLDPTLEGALLPAANLTQ